MAMIRQIILAFALCSPALATPAQDALYDKVMASDIAAVEKVLIDAVAQDEAPDHDPELQRDMFSVFVVTDPKIDAFTDKWLQKEPTSPYAMTARGWYLIAMAGAHRGADWARNTHRDAFDRMVEFDTEALAMFTDATKAAPRLLSASDGLIRLTQSVAPKEMIPLELERIMTLHPNRGSLMRAMYTLAPQWGGNADEVRLVCGRYAPLITSIKDYTPDVCNVDAVYFGGFAQGRVRDAASIALQKLDNPILDYARVLNVLDGKGTAARNLAVLEKAKSERMLSPDEALAYDIANNAVNHISTDISYAPAYKLALSQGIDALRIAADRNPLSTSTLLAYMKRLGLNSRDNGVDAGEAGNRARLQVLLTAIPHSWRGWMALASASTGGDADATQRVRGYLQNSIYYSNFSLEALQNAVSTLTAQTDIYAKRKATSGKSNLTPDDVAELDRLGRCPILALTRITQAVCADRGIAPEQCFDTAYAFLLKPMLQDIEARGVCQTEANAPFGSLLQGPVPADF